MRKFTDGAVQAQLLPSENPTLKSPGRFAVGRDTDGLAADTVIRYGADSSIYRIRGQEESGSKPAKS